MPKEQPAKINQVVTPCRIPPKVILGRVGKMETELLLDTGADRSIIHSKFVSPGDYTNNVARVKGYRGDAIEIPEARIWIHVKNYSVRIEALVDDASEREALIGRDMGPALDALLMDSIIDNYIVAKPTPEEKRCVESKTAKEVEEVSTLSVTRAGKRKEKEEADKVQKSIELEQPIPTEPALIVENTQENTQAQTVQNSPEGIDVPLPVWIDGGGKLLRKELLEDESLKKIRQLADEREKGYIWDNGLIKHNMEGEAGEQWCRFVVPVGRRREVLRVGPLHPHGWSLEY